MKSLDELKANQYDLEDLFRIYLHEIEQADIDRMLEITSQFSVDIVKPPTTGLLMINVLDCFDTPFHLGEVLVTTAEIMYGTQRGVATVMGRCPERAALAASVTAIIQKDGPLALEELQEILFESVAKIDQKRDKESRLAASTRVAFENMAKE